MSFWANKLNGTKQTTPIAPVNRELYGLYTPVPQQQQYIPEAFQPQAQYQPSVPMTPGSVCPGCGSSSYTTKVQGHPGTPACPECGYHPRFQQSGYARPRTSPAPQQGENKATPARQAAQTQTLKGSLALLNAGGGEHIQSL